MMNLAFTVLGLGLLFYLAEVTDEKPSVVHAGVFIGAVIEAVTFMALRA
jgi:hypothetical protein